MGSESVSEHLEVSSTQRRVLDALRRRSEATVDELAEALDVTPSAVRQHLAPLRSVGLVAARPQRGQAGRPADVYRCTPASDQLFPTEQNLAVEILDDLYDEDPSLVEQLFGRRRRRMVDDARDRLGGAPVVERVAAITDQFDAQGYLADFDQMDDGGFRIQLHNCPIRNVADRYPHACAAELGFIEDVLPETQVTRVSRKSDRCSSCTYRIEPVRDDEGDDGAVTQGGGAGWGASAAPPVRRR